MGIQNTFIVAGMISLAMTIMPIGLLIWGKRAREHTAAEYRRFALRQPLHRSLALIQHGNVEVWPCESFI